MPKGYDRISRYYDSLAGIIFGRAIKHAQAQGLSAIMPDSKVLIVGGGTGYVLEAIDSLRLANIHVDYIDPSKGMISQAAKRRHENLSVRFLNVPIEAAKLDEAYDVVITQFFLDSFEGAALKDVFQLLNGHLKKDGYWVVADFKIGSGWNQLWQRPLTALMYLFFRLTVGIKAGKLEDYSVLFSNHDYQLMRSKTFFMSFIFSSTYKK